MPIDSSDDDIEIIESDSDPTSTRTLRRRSTSVQGKDFRKNLDTFAEPEVRKLVSDSNFLTDFDPEKSSREQRKLTRKYSGPMIKSIYDDKGRYRHDKSDLCDCLVKTCPGCHFPCSTCKSPKCAVACRSYRKWAFESIEHDGKDLIIKNPLIDPKTGALITK